ncbi:Kinesin light chain, partial [Trichoplax sp. H2]
MVDPISTPNMATGYSESEIFQKIQFLCAEGEKKYIDQDNQNAIPNYQQALDQIQLLPKKDTDLELQYKINLRITDIYIQHNEWSQANKFSPGDIKRMTGDESGALSDFATSLDMKLKSLDGDNLSIGDTYHKVGRTYFSQKEYNKALSICQKALKIRINKLGDCDLIVAQSYHNIGLAYNSPGMYNDAINMNKKSLEINLAKLGLLHRSTKQNNQVILMLQKAIDILTFNYGENHRNIANTYTEVATCYRHLHQDNLAANMRQKADSIRKDLQNSPH